MADSFLANKYLRWIFFPASEYSKIHNPWGNALWPFAE